MTYLYFTVGEKGDAGPSGNSGPNGLPGPDVNNRCFKSIKKCFSLMYFRDFLVEMVIQVYQVVKVKMVK
jgi:hypothetical protein